jgi:hypothetical protein
LQFDRVYRQSAAAVKSRIAYLFPQSGESASLARYLVELAKLLDLAKRQNVRVVAIKMPTPGLFRAQLPNEVLFDEAISRLLARYGIEFDDFSPQLDEPQFYFDTDHLNRAGVMAFFARHLKATFSAAP